MMRATALLLAPYVFTGERSPERDDGVHFPDAPRLNESRVTAVDELVVRVRSGDRAAFRTLMQNHYNALVRFVASLTGSGDTAEDLVQEIFVRVWDGRERLDPRRAIRAYLFTAARRRVLDLQKHERAQRRLMNDLGASLDDAMAGAIHTDLSDDARDEERRLTALARALAALPERHRTALVLRFEQEMTHAEIGAVLGCSDKAAQQVVLRTLAGLRQLLLP